MAEGCSKDPYGRMTKIQGDKDSPFTYTGHFWHAQSGLNLALFRAYDPNLGRWISRDRIAETGGVNLYLYVKGDPIAKVDPFGLKECPCPGGNFDECVKIAMRRKRIRDRDIYDYYGSQPDLDFLHFMGWHPDDFGPAKDPGAPKPWKVVWNATGGRLVESANNIKEWNQAWDRWWKRRNDDLEKSRKQLEEDLEKCVNDCPSR